MLLLGNKDAANLARIERLRRAVVPRGGGLRGIHRLGDVLDLLARCLEEKRVLGSRALGIRIDLDRWNAAFRDRYQFLPYADAPRCPLFSARSSARSLRSRPRAPG